METERILLRHWQDSDADVLYEYAKEPEVGERAGWPPHNSREQSLEIIRTVFNNPTTFDNRLYGGENKPIRVLRLNILND